MKSNRTRVPRGPDRQYSPDAELGKSFAVGCGVLLVLFVLGSIVIAYFWMR